MTNTDQTATAPLDLAPIRAREAAATPGPWEPSSHEHGAAGCQCLSCHDVVGWLVDHPQASHCGDLVAAGAVAGEVNEFGKPLVSCEHGPLLSLADVEFATSAREDVPLLLAEVDRLRKALQVCEYVVHRVKPTDAEVHAAQQASGAYCTDWQPDHVRDDLTEDQFQYLEETT